MAETLDTTEFRKGLKIEIEGVPFEIIEFQHVKPGKGSAFVRTRIKNLLNNNVLDRTFKSGDKFYIGSDKLLPLERFLPKPPPPPGTPTTVKAAPPKIPLQTPTPKSTSGADSEANNALFPPETKSTKSTSSTPTETTSEPTKSTSESKETSGSETKTSAESEAPSPLLLDTNAASVYNPYNYPASLFGDPGLAIDGEASTAWTAQVQPENAPKMAEGLLLDLKSPQMLGSAVVKTTTTGITVEVYGTNGATPPTSISDPAWARIVGLKVLKKKSTTLKLKTKGKGYRYILLWLAKAPATSTAAAPGSVSINEFELFRPK